MRLVVSSVVLKNINHLKNPTLKNGRIPLNEPLPDTILTACESGKVWTPLPLLIVVSVNFHPFSLFDIQHTSNHAPRAMIQVEGRGFLLFKLLRQPNHSRRYKWLLREYCQQ
jgi:hypothetical protein